MLTSGGDCPGLNAVLRGVTEAADKRIGEASVSVMGSRAPPAQSIHDIGPCDHGWNHAAGRDHLGTTNKGHFVAKMGSGDKIMIPSDIVDKARATLKELGRPGLVVIGGDGSLDNGITALESGVPNYWCPRRSITTSKRPL